MKEANFYKIENNNIYCKLCHHFCIIKDGDAGICRVRKNIEQELYSLVYGRPVSLNIDPIEKKPLFHFLPGTATFSLGTLGCNFRCANCQNWDISQPEEQKINNSSEIVTPETIIKKAIENDCRSISYTYNEPTVWTEYALDIMKLAKKNNLKNIWVSNGYMSDGCLREILPYLDAANIDLKSFDDNFYLKNCDAKLEPVLENLKTIFKSKVHLEITTLVIPGLSGDLKMLSDLAGFIFSELEPTVPWHISRFFGDISWQLDKIKPTEIESLKNIYKLGKDIGLKYIYVGNANTDLGNTFCPNCGELNITRIGYNINRRDNNGKCHKCQSSLNIILK